MKRHLEYDHVEDSEEEEKEEIEEDFGEADSDQEYKPNKEVDRVSYAYQENQILATHNINLCTAKYVLLFKKVIF